MPPRLPFGKEARTRLLKQHFAAAGPITPATAWQFIYEELLWIDGSTGLAHLYESDKAQPGRPWYERTVLFTDMLCARFGNISREALKLRIDRLFRGCLELLLQQTGADDPEAADVLAAIATQPDAADLPAGLAPLATDAAPAAESYLPDADLVAEFATILAARAGLDRDQAEQLARALVTRARLYFTVERKRQNVLGEGFEDLLQLLITRVGGVPPEEIVVRKRANMLPGFQGPSSRERIEAPDIALVRNGQTELLASVKWSLRHDRQKQLSDELDCYVDLLSQERFPTYILITNEYDPGRLVNTAGLARRGQKINHIYHINLELLIGALHTHDRAKDLQPLIADGRLKSIASLLGDLRERSELRVDG